MSTAVKKKSSALDKIIVRRPTPPPELLAGPAPTAVNPEFEQKPLAEFDTRTSEDLHGGSELTFSMPTQQNKGGGGGAQRQAQESGGAPQHGGAHQRQESGAGSKGGVAGSGDVRQEESDVRHLQSGGNAAEMSGSIPHGQQISEETEGQHRGNAAEGGVGEYEEDAAEGGVGEYEEEGEDYEYEEEEEDNAYGSGTGVFNTAQVVDVRPGRLRKSDLRRLQTEFYRILEMLAEEKTRYFDPSLVGNMVKVEYNVKKMALRRYEGKPPTRYKAPRVREAVVLVLDNSGSMTEWTDMLRAMAELAAKRRDVEVYLAPNGYVEEQIAPVRRKVSHDDFMKKMSGRKIIYVGDFDGANTPIELSWRNEVIWIAPEGRYRRFRSHNWVKYDEPKHKGAFIRAFTIDDVMKGLRKVLGGAKWIDMCKRCEDE